MKRRSTVRLALRTRLLTVSSLPAVRHWEGERVTQRPTPDLPYVRETFLPGPARVDGLPAELGTETVDGVYLVDAFWPVGDAGAGLLAFEQFAEDVVHAFRPGVPNGVLATGDANVRVDVLGASSARVLIDDPRLQGPLTIRWRSQVPNALTP